MTLKAPFPYFGGKSLIADTVWETFGPGVRNYVEPFAGSLATLLARPSPRVGPETVNDWSCGLVNAWRAIRSDPAGLAELCVDAVSEVDAEARNNYLVQNADTLRRRLGDPDFSDVKLAAWWIKGACEWIGSGYNSGEGPWAWTPEEGWSKRGTGVNRQLPHLGNAGKGVNRQLPHLGDAGKGYRQQRVDWLLDWFSALSDRLAGVRIACGDWKRVLGPSSTVKHGTTAVFLDPPYEGTEYVYGKGGDLTLSQECFDWCVEHGTDPKLRIVLCGRGVEHDGLLLLGWRRHEWKTRKGYGSDSAETLWTNCNP